MAAGMVVACCTAGADDCQAEPEAIGLSCCLLPDTAGGAGAAGTAGRAGPAGRAGTSGAIGDTSGPHRDAEADDLGLEPEDAGVGIS